MLTNFKKYLKLRQSIGKSGKFYALEKKEQTQYLVKWKGFDNSFNPWIKRSWIR